MKLRALLLATGYSLLATFSAAQTPGTKNLQLDKNNRVLAPLVDFSNTTVTGLASAGYATLFGTGAPANGTGNNGDVYYRTDSPYGFYKKAANTWAQQSAVNGPQIIAALSSNALVLGPMNYARYEATWSSGTSNRTFTFASGANIPGNGVRLDMAFTNPTTVNFPSCYRNGSGTPITSYTYATSARCRLAFTVRADGSTIDLNDDDIGIIPIANLATGTPDGTKFIADDGTLKTPAGGGGGALATGQYVMMKTGTALPSGFLTPDGTNGTVNMAAIGGCSWFVKGNGTPVVTVGTPTFSPSAGSYSSTQTVTISSANSAAIKYTTDGSTPSRSVGILVSGAVSVAATSTLKAVGYSDLSIDSVVGSAAYTINLGPQWVKNIANGFTANTTTYTFSTTATVGAGNTIAFPWANSGSANVTAVNGGGLTWTVVPGVTNSQSWGCVFAFAPSGLASGTTITVTTNGGAYFSLFYDLEEFSGVLNSATPDASNALSGAGWGSPYSCSVVTTQTNDLVFGGVLAIAGGTWSIGASGYTVGTSPPVSYTDTFYPVWKIVSGQGPTDVGGNYSASQNIEGAVVALKHQ